MSERGGAVAERALAPLRAAYYRRMRNVGDAITPLVLEAFTGRPVTVVRSPDDDHVLSIGSVLQTSTPRSYVWGTGLVDPSVGVGTPDPARVLAVRGKLTHAALRRAGVSVGDVPLGDPGYLVPEALGVRAAAAPRYRLGLVPYLFDRDHPFFADAARDPDVEVLDVCAPPAAFFAELASCAAIASSSLHGLIFGEALGLPTLWLDVSGNIVEGRFKYLDWFSLAGNAQTEPHTPRAFTSAGEIAARCETRQIAIDRTALRAALRPDVIDACSEYRADAGAALLPVAECRTRGFPVFVASAASVSVIEGDERSTVPVMARPSDAVEAVNEAVRAFFASWAEPTRYVIGTQTNDFTALTPNVLRLYDEMLDRFHLIESVGPLADGQVGLEPAGGAHTACGCRIVGWAPETGVSLYRSTRPIRLNAPSFRLCSFHHRDAPLAAFAPDDYRRVVDDQVLFASRSQ